MARRAESPKWGSLLDGIFLAPHRSITHNHHHFSLRNPHQDRPLAPTRPPPRIPRNPLALVGAVAPETAGRQGRHGPAALGAWCDDSPRPAPLPLLGDFRALRARLAAVLPPAERRGDRLCALLAQPDPPGPLLPQASELARCRRHSFTGFGTVSLRLLHILMFRPVQLAALLAELILRRPPQRVPASPRTK